MVITNTFSPNTVIASAKFNTNFQTDVRDKFNAMINGSTGHTHDGATGNGSPIVLKNAVPSVTRQLGYGSGLMQYYDGAIAQQVLSNRAANTMGASGSIDFSSIADSLRLPSGTPTLARSAAFINNQLHIFDSAADRIYVPIDKDSSVLFNLGLKLSAGAISVTGLGNTPLATDNAAWVSYPGSTAGIWLTQTITADQTIASGGIKGRCGTTASVAWGSDMPIGVYVTSKDDTASGIRFFISRNPAMTTTPASTNNIGIDGTAPATSSQNNIVLFGSAANTGYNSRPCRLIGACRGTIDNSAGGVMTITALDANDGIGDFYNLGTRWFTMPLAQNGGGGTAPAAGNHILTNGGTVPTWTNKNYLYRVSIFGEYNLYLDFNGDAGGDGAGAVNTLIALPAAYIPQSASYSWGAGAHIKAAAVDQFCGIGFDNNNGATVLTTFRNSSSTAVGQWVLSDFANGARLIQVDSLKYQAFS